MNELINYLTQDSLIKLAYTKVSDRAADWPKDVLDAFYTEFPSLINYDVKIMFRDKNEAKGYGVGSLQVAGLTLPVIIRDFSLAPIDVALAGGKIIPFTRESIASLLSQKSAFKSLQPVDADQSFLSTFQTSLNAAAGGNIVPVNNTEAIYEKTGSVLDKLAGKVSADKKKKVVAATKSKSIQKCATDAAKQVFDKLANIAVQASVPDLAESITRKIPRDIYYIYKKGQYQYDGIFGNSKIDDPVYIKNMERGSIQGVPLLKTAAGPKLNVEEILKAESEIGILPTAGSYGFIKFANDESTVPFTVTNIANDNNSVVINGHDTFGERHFYILRGIDTPVDHESDKLGMYIPTSAKFVALDKKPDSVKLAKLANKIVKIDEESYRIFGPQLSKYAEMHNSPETWKLVDTIWAVLNTGADEDDITKISNLKPGEEYVIGHELHIPVPLSEVVAHIENELLKRADLTEPNIELIKLAAYLPTRDTVDAVIGLNFISKVNIQEFIDLLPVYEAVASSLARLLIAVRMGLDKVPEEPVKTAMKEITKVIYFLRGVQNLQKVQ